MVDLLSNESENIEECSLENGDMTISDDVDHSGCFPVPCSRTIRTHKRHFGNLPGFWNKTFQEEDEPKEVRSELYDLLEQGFANFCSIPATFWQGRIITGRI